MNVHVISGRMGKDARGIGSGDNKGASFSVATSRRRKRGSEWVEETCWFECVVWGRLAEFILTYGGKGRMVEVAGEGEIREYEKAGARHRAYQINVDKLELKGPRSDARDQGGQRGYGGGTQGAGYMPNAGGAYPAPAYGPDAGADDIPF